jgi:hypothetical protein
MPETEGTQSGESEKPIRPNRIDHLPGSSRDVQFSSLSRVASRIVKDKPRRTDSGRAISPRTDAQSILDSVQYSDAAAIRYLEQVKKVAEPWHVSLASAAFCSLSWPHCSDKTSELRESLEDARDKVRQMLGLGLIDTSHHCQNLTRSYWQQKRSESENFPSLWPDESTSLDELTRHMTQDFDKMTDNLLDKVNKFNALDPDRTYNTIASLMKLEHTKILACRAMATLESAEGAFALALGDYSTYSKLMWLDWKPQAGSAGSTPATGSQSGSKSTSDSQSKSNLKSESESESKVGSTSKMEPKMESKMESESAEISEMSGALLAPPPTPVADSTPISMSPGWIPHVNSFLATESESESESESKSLLKSQWKPKSDSESKSESELESKVESKPESQSGLKSGSKSESKSKAEPESMMTLKLELDLADDYDGDLLASVLRDYSDNSSQMRVDFRPLEESFLDTVPEPEPEPEHSYRYEYLYCFSYRTYLSVLQSALGFDRHSFAALLAPFS